MLDGIAPEALRPFLDRLRRRRYQPGEVLLRQGERPAEMFLLEQGNVEVLLAARGREHVLAELGAPSSVGEMSLFTGAPVSATVRVAGAAAVDVLVLQAADLAELGQVFPVVYRNRGQRRAGRRARSNARGAPEAVGEIVCLRDLGGPPLLAEALAASIAWHTRGSTVLAGG